MRQEKEEEQQQEQQDKNRKSRALRENYLIIKFYIDIGFPIGNGLSLLEELGIKCASHQGC